MSKITSRDGVKFKIGRTKTLATVYRNSPIPENRKSKDKSSSSKQEKQFSSMPSAYSEINYERRNQKRATAIKEICNNNFHIGSMMVTLTFDPKMFCDKDLTNIQTTYSEFKRFIKRMNHHYENFIYIATFSKQGNGSWHYHMMCNLDSKTSESDIKEIWGNGSISINLICSHRHFIKEVDYLIKNMKEVSEELKGKRGYLCSKNVERDIIVDSKNILQAEKYDKIRKKFLDYIYYCKKHGLNPYRFTNGYKIYLGAIKEMVDNATGELVYDLKFNQELTEPLKKSGYKEFYYEMKNIFLRLRFNDMFSKFKTATRRKKENKRTSSKNNHKPKSKASK